MIKLNIMYYNLLYFVIVMLYSPLLFAPWSYELRPGPPNEGLLRTCPEWINYHGFTLDNYVANREMARTRTHMLDMNAHRWAAIYAYVIDEVESTKELLPETFCDNVALREKPHRYHPLKDGIKTCTGWITFYQFSLDDVSYNVSYARNRSPGKNYAISIWADSYSSYLATDNKLTPTEFCSKIGKYRTPRNRYQRPDRRYRLEIDHMPFMSEYETNFTCEGWIALYGFHDDLAFNYEKAIELIEEQSNYHIIVQYWLKEYCNFLQTSYYSDDVKNEDKLPKGFCKLQNEDDLATYNFHYAPDEHQPFED